MASSVVEGPQVKVNIACPEVEPEHHEVGTGSPEVEIRLKHSEVGL